MRRFVGLLSLFCVSIVSSSSIPQTSPKPRFIFENVSGGGTYKTGAPAYLSVKVTDNGAVDENDDWKFCTWRRMRDNADCRFSYNCVGSFCDIGVGDFTISTDCSQALANRVAFFGEDPNVENHVCGLQIKNVLPEDSGDWRVMVEECRVTGCGTSDGNGNIIETTVNIVVQ